MGTGDGGGLRGRRPLLFRIPLKSNHRTYGNRLNRLPREMNSLEMLSLTAHPAPGVNHPNSVLAMADFWVALSLRPPFGLRPLRCFICLRCLVFALTGAFSFVILKCIRSRKQKSRPRHQAAMNPRDSELPFRASSVYSLKAPWRLLARLPEPT